MPAAEEGAPIGVVRGGCKDATPAQRLLLIRAKTERLRENYMLMSMTMSSV